MWDRLGNGLRDAVTMVAILVRVAIFVAVALAIFAITFLGYITLPLIVLGGFMIAFAVNGFLRSRIKRRGKGNTEGQ